MFCIKCGEKLDEDSKFCIKCGAVVDTPVVPNTQPPVMAPVTPVQMKTDTAQGITNQASCQDQFKTVEPPKKKNKLLSIAIIVASTIFVVIVTFSFIYYNYSLREWQEYHGRQILNDLQMGKKIPSEVGGRFVFAKERGFSDRDAILFAIDTQGFYTKKEYNRRFFGEDFFTTVVVFLSFLTISIILNLLGHRKNNKKLILSAGIVYLVSFCGIPSAIMCFVAYAKMKKA